MDRITKHWKKLAGLFLVLAVATLAQFQNGQPAANQQLTLVGGSDGTTARTFLTDSGGRQVVSIGNVPGATDPCQSVSALKSSVSISITAATTTQLVAPSGSTAVYVCGATFTVAPSATTADTIQFITGTGATCGGSTVTKTGTFGNGDLTSAAPVVPISFADPGTSFSAAASSGVCVITTGTAVNVQGILTFVQE